MNGLHDLPAPMAAAVKTETSGEIVRWVGRPNARRAFLGGLGAWVMGIPWTVFMGGIFSVLVAAGLSGKPPASGYNPWHVALLVVMIVFTSAFVLVGLYMLATPFVAWAKARRTVYVITDKRVLTLSVAQTRSITALSGDRIIKTTRRERRDGSGTLRIVTGREKDSDGDWHETAEELLSVPEVRVAERLVIGLMPAR